MSKHLEKFHVIHLWLGQHDALCDQNYVWCDPHTVAWPTKWAVWHGGLGRPGSAGVECCLPPNVEKTNHVCPLGLQG